MGIKGSFSNGGERKRKAEWLLNQRQRQQMDIVLSGSLGKPINNISACMNKTEEKKIHFIFIQTQQNLHKNEHVIGAMGSGKKSDNEEKREQDQSWHHQQTQLGYLIQFSYFAFIHSQTAKKHFKV